MVAGIYSRSRFMNDNQKRLLQCVSLFPEQFGDSFGLDSGPDKATNIINQASAIRIYIIGDRWIHYYNEKNPLDQESHWISWKTGTTPSERFYGSISYYKKLLSIAEANSLDLVMLSASVGYEFFSKNDNCSYDSSDDDGFAPWCSAVSNGDGTLTYSGEKSEDEVCDILSTKISSFFIKTSLLKKVLEDFELSIKEAVAKLEKTPHLKFGANSTLCKNREALCLLIYKALSNVTIEELNDMEKPNSARQVIQELFHLAGIKKNPKDIMLPLLMGQKFSFPDFLKEVLADSYPTPLSKNIDWSEIPG